MKTEHLGHGQSRTRPQTQPFKVCLPSVGSCVRSVSTTLLPRAATASTGKNNDPQSATQRAQEQPTQQQTELTGFYMKQRSIQRFQKPFLSGCLYEQHHTDGWLRNICSNIWLQPKLHVAPKPRLKPDALVFMDLT